MDTKGIGDWPKCPKWSILPDLSTPQLEINQDGPFYLISLLHNWRSTKESKTVYLADLLTPQLEIDQGTKRMLPELLQWCTKVDYDATLT